MNAMQTLLDFLGALERQRLFFRLSRVREETIMVEVAVPGARWEVEFFANGHVEVEVFNSSTGIEGEEALARLFAKHAE